MSIYFRNHPRLRVTGISLYGLDVTARQYQLVSNAAMPQAMKGNFGKTTLCNKPAKTLGNKVTLNWSTIFIRENQPQIYAGS